MAEITNNRQENPKLGKSGQWDVNLQTYIFPLHPCHCRFFNPHILSVQISFFNLEKCDLNLNNNFYGNSIQNIKHRWSEIVKLPNIYISIPIMWRTDNKKYTAPQMSDRKVDVWFDTPTLLIIYIARAIQRRRFRSNNALNNNIKY